MMTMMLVLCLASALQAPAQVDQAKDARYYRQQAAAAFKVKDYAGALAHLKKADELIPNHPTIVYNLAVAHTALGSRSEAIKMLHHLAAMGLAYAVEKDVNFAAIKDADEFTAVVKRLQANKAPLVRSETAFTVDEKGLVVESVAYDPAEEAFYVSSVHRRKIIRLGRDGAAKTFATEQDGLWSVLGIKVDARRRLLWAVSSAFPQMTGFSKEEEGKSGVFKFDLKTGKLLKTYRLPNRPKAHALGDLILTAGGDVYASDSVTPALYRIDARTDELELFLEHPEFASPQGMAFTDDESHMFLADYGKGLFRIDMKTRAVTHIKTPPEATFLGIDGLYYYRGSLIAIQNGINPQRLIRVSLSPDRSRATGVEVLEASHPDYDEPTLGVIVKDRFYFVANSQWGSVDEKGAMAPEEKLHHTLILKLRLP